MSIVNLFKDRRARHYRGPEQRQLWSRVWCKHIFFTSFGLKFPLSWVTLNSKPYPEMGNFELRSYPKGWEVWPHIRPNICFWLIKVPTLSRSPPAPLLGHNIDSCITHKPAVKFLELNPNLVCLRRRQARITRKKDAVPTASAITPHTGDCELLLMSAEAGSESDVATRVNPFSTEEAFPTNKQETKVTAELAFEATNARKRHVKRTPAKKPEISQKQRKIRLCVKIIPCLKTSHRPNRVTE